jgi:hypothetical protein
MDEKPIKKVDPQEQKLRTENVKNADKEWTDYAQLAPENRTPRILAELWSKKEKAKAALKKLLK